MFEATKYPIGLDISNTSLKLIQLKKEGGLKMGKKKSASTLEVNCYNSIKVPPGLIVNGEIKNQEEVVNLINKLINTAKGGKINTKEVMTVLPAAETFIKSIQIPTVQEEEIPAKISEEIVKHIPLILDEVYLDWQLINQNNSQLDVLVGTTPRKYADQYIEILENAGLQPIALEIEAVSIHRALITEPEKNKNADEAYLIIDLGASRSSVILCSQETVYLTISAPISGDAITKQILETLKIDSEKAEKAKRVCGLSKDKCKGALREILDEMLNKLIAYIEQATSFFQANYQQKQIKEIILCGGGANFLEIDKILFEHLKITVNRGNPWQKINQNKNNKFNQLNKNSLSYTTAIGLALRGQVVDE